MIVKSHVGGGQFHTFKLRPYYTRKHPSLSFTVLMSMPHAHLKAGFNFGGPRSFQKSPWEDSYSNTCMICSHVKVKACKLRSQLHFFLLLHMQSYRSINICKSDLTHLHMHKQEDTSYQLHMYRQLLRNVACPSYTHAIPLLSLEANVTHASSSLATVCVYTCTNSKLHSCHYHAHTFIHTPLSRMYTL